MKPFTVHAGMVAALPRAHVDTDQIIPKQFLKRTGRTGFGECLFFDWRYLPDGRENPGFELNRPEARGATILVAGENFGCGSSREHAPQAMLHWGIKAIVGESFADIFFGNCVALGIPCVIAAEADVAALMSAVEQDPAHDMVVDVDAQTVSYRDKVYKVSIPAGTRQQLLEGTWDATRILLQAADLVRETAKRLPYVGGFKA